MNNLILIDGVDGVGKTEMAKMLSLKGYKYVDIDLDPTISIAENYRRILTTDYHANAVIDSSFISEMVYGPLQKGYSAVSDDDFSSLLSLVKEQNGKVVLLDAGPETIMRRLYQRDNRTTMTEEQVASIRRAYRELLLPREECKIDLIRNDHEMPERLLDKVMRTEIPLECLIFDFDRTLYKPEEVSILNQLKYRMGDFIQRNLGVSYTDAQKIRKEYRKRYGSTAIGLHRNHGIDQDDFIKYAYDLDLSELHKDETLKANLHALEEKKIIYTNATEDFVRRALAVMGVEDEFCDIIGMNRLNLAPKSDPKSYEETVALHAESSRNCVLFDDCERNLKTAKEQGSQTVLCNEEAAEQEVVDFQTNDLPNDLMTIMKKIKRERGM